MKDNENAFKGRMERWLFSGKNLETTRRETEITIFLIVQKFSKWETENMWEGVL